MREVIVSKEEQFQILGLFLASASLATLLIFAWMTDVRIREIQRQVAEMQMEENEWPAP